eukprot:3085789-Rhodomonas_salina.3
MVLLRAWGLGLGDWVWALGSKVFAHAPATGPDVAHAGTRDAMAGPGSARSGLDMGHPGVATTFGRSVNWPVVVASN